MDIKLWNTLSHGLQTFSPREEGVVKMYNCGPTVYGKQHIGNLSMYVFTDVLRRALEYFGYKVDQVINITDFGHLSSDNDEGEDKMTKGLHAEGLDISMENMRKLAHKYADIFLADIKRLNIETKDIKFPFASDYIEEQKNLIERLEEKGFTYQISDGIYFDTTKFPDYGKLGNIKEGNESRIGENNDKKNQRDFALWKFSRDLGKELGWQSKWGKGFPGWHIECTAMIFKLLGEQIDIHTGGIEHIPVHHNNEIAQAEAASGKAPFSRFWLHREHIRLEDTKIAKSTGNVLYLSDLIEKGIHPLSYRYWMLTSKYNTPSNFTWEAIEGAQSALERIVSSVAEKFSKGVISEGNLAKLPKESFSAEEFLKKFNEVIADDLNTPIAIALLQDVSDIKTMEEMDKVLGLNIKKLAEEIMILPSEIKALKKERDEARENNDWKRSDDLRDKIESLGFLVQDTENGTVVKNTLKNLAKTA